jgi:LysR family transcriptional regulator, transcriptional activator for dmlA
MKSEAGKASGPGIQAQELGFLVALAGQGSLSAAAIELGLSKAAVSKRLASIEARTGVALVQRTTRRMSFTAEGDAVVERARRIVADMEELGQMLTRATQVPKGLLRVNATLGFGRSHVAPLISRFVQLHPEVQVQLQLSVNPPPLTDDSFDVCFRFGPPPDSRVMARRLAPNRRLLCAAPAYLLKHGEPQTPQDLLRHNCIGIRQGDEAYGTWRLSTGKGSRQRSEAVKTRGNLTTNDGEIAVRWALEGHGIVMRAEWDIAHHLSAGRLVPVLPQWQTPDADILAVIPHRLQLSARVRAFVNFVAESFAAGPSVPSTPSLKTLGPRDRRASPPPQKEKP